MVVVDSGPVAGGASGRCGGFANSSITHGLAHGAGQWPGEIDAIVALQNELWDDTLDLLGRKGAGDVIEPVGKLTVALRPHQLADLDASEAVHRSHGYDVERLDADALADRVRSPTYLGGVELRTAHGLCDPARLAWSLADIAEAEGATLAEHTTVTDVSSNRRGATLVTDTGARVEADRILLATNAAPPLLRRLRMRMIPVYDHVIATEPLSARHWAEIGWDRRQGITDAGNQFHYYRPTPEGGILFGGWDATYHFGGRVDPAHEQRRATHELLVRHLHTTFPALRDLAVSHTWGGPIDSTTRFTPMFGSTRDGRIGWAIGYTGLGVGASRFGALASLDLLYGRTTDRTALSMVQRQPLPFPPEPLRWPVVQVTKRALLREDRTGHRGPWLRLLDRFGVGFDT